MIVAIDAGNTRIKWGVHDGAAWVAQGALPTADTASLAMVCANWPQGARLVASNVAGEAVGAAIRDALAGRAAAPLWLRPGDEACGVRNGYDQPGRLGADRWAALIGARGRVAGDCLVVCTGTATTVDWLAADGVFRGGLILPGFELMRRSLALNTAQLPLADGRVSREPRNTMDAIVSGSLYAQVGAIERRFAEIAAADAVCLLTGGAAQCMTPHLNIPFRLVDNLVLDGLVRFVISQ